MQMESSPATKSAIDHYDGVYFALQNKDGDLRAELNKAKFSPFLEAEYRSILDFGCGGGWLLKTIYADSKIGIEINPIAQEHARSFGIQVYRDLSEVADGSVDAIISNHALEHVERPFEALRQMKRVLRPGGLLILVVPCDRANFPFNTDDQDYHLFSWSAGTLGNLVTAAGFRVTGSAELVHRWPPGWATIYRRFGPTFFHFASRVYGAIRRNRTQVRVVAVA
jgi:SAM-dependent methyltransferase